jgi:lipase
VPPPEPRNPQQVPELIYVDAGDLRLAVWEWPGDDPPLLFAHATGFHGRCWDRIIRQLPRRRRCLAPEARGHGRSSKPAPPYHWPAFGLDLVRIAEHFKISEAIGIGHSLGGHLVTSVAASRPATFSQLLLLDPTIRRRDIYGTTPFDAGFIRRRRVRWPSPEAMLESFRGRQPFDRWRIEVLRDYCEYGLLRQGDEYLLACPPEAEASVYECSRLPEADLHSVIPSIAQPVTVLRAGAMGRPLFSDDPSPSPTDPQLAALFPLGRDMLLPLHSHYIPMEDPDLVAEQIRGML